jgi:SAM-dependent methyltransferase
VPASEDSAARWQRTYAEHPVSELSWTEAVPTTSLDLIAEAELPRDAALIDVGGGASGLAGELVHAGYSEVTVADISTEALDRAQADLGEDAGRVTWIEADLRDHDFGRRFDLWHDRAVFHFMVDAADRRGYLSTLERTLRPGGHLILATFGPDGPERCSGLPVKRYDAEAISQTLGAEFETVSSRLADHRTPSGRRQEFLFSHLRRLAR